VRGPLPPGLVVKQGSKIRLMKAELKIARKEIAELRREGANERHWLYAESSLEECSASLEIISRLIQKQV
jgi:hypothetical protein